MAHRTKTTWVQVLTPPGNRSVTCSKFYKTKVVLFMAWSSIALGSDSQARKCGYRHKANTSLNALYQQTPYACANQPMIIRLKTI
jgi:hypothetical protein